MFKHASEVGRQRRAVKGGGGRNSGVKEKMRVKRGRKRWTKI